MGEMADYYIDLMLEQRCLREDEGIEIPNFEYWTTKEGKSIKVCNLSSHHISNIIALIKRTGTNLYKDTWIKRLEKELREREVKEWN